MNAWVLKRDLDALAQSGLDEDLRLLAARVAKAYLYPVDSLVVSSAGEILDHASVDDTMVDEGRYLRLLDAAK